MCEINLFFTEIDGDDNARIIIPNGKLWGEIVRVPTRNDTARIELAFQRPANDDIGAAIARLKELIERDKRVLRVADIGVDSVGDGNYTLAAHVWVTRRDATAVRFDLNRTVKEEFERRAQGRAGRWSAAPDRASIARHGYAAVALPVEISDWKPAPFALGGETVFAIGDVHGCAGELRALLDAIARPGRRSAAASGA